VKTAVHDSTFLYARAADLIDIDIALAGGHANHGEWDIKVNAVEEVVADERKA
jgi:hypothetical protein